MKKVTEFLEKYVGKVAYFLQSEPHFASIINGINVTIPITIIGGFACIITSTPSTAAVEEGTFLYNFFTAWANLAAGPIGSLAKMIFNITFGLLSIYVVIAIAISLADKYKLNKTLNAVTAVMVFIMVAGPITSIEGTNGLPSAYFDAKGLFTAMIVGCLTVEITNQLFKHNIKIKLPSSVPANIAQPFEQLIPMLVNIVAFYLLSVLCQTLTGGLIPKFILDLLKPLLSQTDTLGAAVIYALLLNGLWIIGVHGGNIVNSVMTPFFLINLTENAAARAAGEELPHVLCSNWHMLGFNYGGSGVAFALCVAALIVAKSEQLKSISKMSFVPVCFNVSEPIVFGYPIVLNPFLAIPFLLVGVFNCVVTYFAMYSGLVGRIFISIPANLPSPLILFLATLDWKAIVLWAILIAVDILIYIPFVKAYDNSLLEKEKKEA